MTIKNLCKMINIPKGVADFVIDYDETVNYSELEEAFKKLESVELWKETVEELQACCGDDPNGFKILTLQMHCICRTYDKYMEIGISEKVFIDTMSFITRFLKSQKDTWGGYAFAWAWWMPRQITMREFRLGELEFEFVVDGDRLLYHVHIPADANLAVADLDAIYPFTEKYFPDKANGTVCCYSWLLSSELRKLLPESANIIKFQNQFKIIFENKDDNGGIGWIYNKEMPYEELPEDTTLRRNMKEHLLSGGKVGAGFGEHEKPAR